MELGQITVSLGARMVLETGESAVLLNRHRSGDYGNVDACINDFAIDDEAHYPIKSVYRCRSGHEIVVITDVGGDTRVSLPQELMEQG